MSDAHGIRNVCCTYSGAERTGRDVAAMMRGSDPKTPAVRSVRRLLEIIEFFASTRKPATLSAIATALALPKSSCLALLETLENAGYVYEIAPRMGYYPTRRWLDAFSVICAADPLAAGVRPVMQSLHARTGETVVFAKRAGRAVAYLDAIESDHAIRYSARAGQLRPLHATASGKAILAALSPQDRRAALGKPPFERITARTVTDLAALESELAESRKRGWYITAGETEREVSGVAVCIAIAGEPYAVVVAGPSYRVDERFTAIGKRLLEAQAQLQAGRDEQPRRRSAY